MWVSLFMCVRTVRAFFYMVIGDKVTAFFLNMQENRRFFVFLPKNLRI